MVALEGLRPTRGAGAAGAGSRQCSVRIQWNDHHVTTRPHRTTTGGGAHRTQTAAMQRPGTKSQAAFGITFDHRPAGPGRADGRAARDGDRPASRGRGNAPPPPGPPPQQQQERREQRPQDALPAARHRREILYLVEQHPVVLVVGETGSGKTTQVPQFLMEAGEPPHLPSRGPQGCSWVAVDLLADAGRWAGRRWRRSACAASAQGHPRNVARACVRAEQGGPRVGGRSP